MRDNFRIYVDRGGNMPQLTHKRWASNTHPYYIRYENNRPVALHGPVAVLAQDITNTKIYSWANHDFVDIATIPQE